MASSAAETFAIPSQVWCSDGPCGDLVRIVIDPVARRVTHLVVEPKSPSGQARLVAVDAVAGTAPLLRLNFTRAEFDRLDPVRETDYIRPEAGDFGFEANQTYALPYFPLAGGGLGMVGEAGTPRRHSLESAAYDRIPVGEVEVRRGERVYATDGPIGHVQGLVVDPADHHVTHVLLEEGHLWGKKDVAIPIGAVTGVEDGIRVSLSKAEIVALPAVPIDR